MENTRTANSGLFTFPKFSKGYNGAGHENYNSVPSTRRTISGPLRDFAIWEAFRARKSDSVMTTNRGEFTAITFEDDSCAVVRSDPSQPRFLEVIATFYDAARAPGNRHSQQT